MADNDEMQYTDADEEKQRQLEMEEEQEEDDESILDAIPSIRKRKLLSQFWDMRKKYMVKSAIWPFLNDEEKQILDSIKKIAASEYVSFMQMVGYKIQLFWAKVKAILAPIVPFIPFILIGLLVIIAFIVILSVLMPWLFGLFSGTSDATFGVNGENFYGMRYVYRDEQQAKADLWADYANALNYTIENFEDENVTLNLKMPYTAEGELDLAKLNATAEEGKFADEYVLAVEIAKDVCLADNLGVENEVLAELDEILAAIKTSGFGTELAEKLDTNLDKVLASIKYFGFDAALVDEIAADLAQLIEDNAALYTLNSAEDGSTPSIDVSDTLQPAFSNLLLQEYVTKLGGTDAPTRTDLLYIKDYILGDDADSTVEGIVQENYVAMIYLPKNNVTISSVTYSVYGVEAVDFNAAICLAGNQVVAKNDDNFDVFSPKQESGAEFDSYHFVAENLTLQALTFTDFEKDFLTSEKSLINILRALKSGSANAELLNNYLAQADETNTAFWADADTEGKTGTGAKYYTFNYQTYLAVLLRNSANTAYSFTEFETNLAQ